MALLGRPVVREAEALRGAVATLRASAELMLRRWESAIESSREGLANVPPGTVDWFRVAAIQVFAGLARSDHAAIERAALAVGAISGTPEPTGPYGFTLMGLTIGLALAGQRRAAEAIVTRIEPLLGDLGIDRAFAAWGHMTVSQAYTYLRDDPGLGVQAAARSVALADAIGDGLMMMNAHYYLGSALLECGDGEAAEKHLAPAAGASFIPLIEGWAYRAIARARLLRGDLDAVPAILRRLAEAPDPLLQRRGKALEARLLLAQGRYDECAVLAHSLVGADALPFDTAALLAILAHVSLVRGETERAHGFVDRAFEATKTGVMPSVLSEVQSLEVRVAEAEGRPDDARRLRDRAVGRVLTIASHQPTDELARRWISRTEHEALHIRPDEELPLQVNGAAPPPRVESRPPGAFADDETVDVIGFGIGSD